MRTVAAATVPTGGKERELRLRKLLEGFFLLRFEFGGEFVAEGGEEFVVGMDLFAEGRGVLSHEFGEAFFGEGQAFPAEIVITGHGSERAGASTGGAAAASDNPEEDSEDPEPEDPEEDSEDPEPAGEGEVFSHDFLEMILVELLPLGSISRLCSK